MAENMVKLKIRLRGLSPIEFGGFFKSEKDPKESHDAFEKRCWRERMATDSEGYVVHNPMAVKNCLSEAAKFQGDTIKGKGKATYTKRFERGVMPLGPMVFMDADGKRIKACDVDGDTRAVPSDGKPGGGTRVQKTFPIIREWCADVELMVLDPLLCEDLDRVRRYLDDGGQFIGLGSFRPEKRGYFGRFTVEKFEAA